MSRFRRSLLAITLAVAITASAHERDARADIGHYVGEAAAGTLGAGVGFVAGAVAGLVVAMTTKKDFFRLQVSLPDVATYTAFMGVAAMGPAAGVTLAGNANHHPSESRFFRSYIGSLLGMGTSALAASLLFEKSQFFSAGVIIAVPLSITGAIIGYHLGLESAVTSADSLINIQKNRHARFGIPGIGVVPSQSGSAVVTAQLLHATF